MERGRGHTYRYAYWPTTIARIAVFTLLTLRARVALVLVVVS